MIKLTHKLIAKSIREKLVRILKTTLTNFSLKLRFQSPCFSNPLKMFGLKCKWHQSYLQVVPWSCLNLHLPKVEEEVEVVEEVAVDVQEEVDVQVVVEDQAELDQVAAGLAVLILVPIQLVIQAPIHQIVALLICQVLQLVMLVVVLPMPQELQLMPLVPQLMLQAQPLMQVMLLKL